MNAATLEKVRKLIALAGSPYEEEARTAAFLACKMIRELGLSFAQAQPAPPAPPPPSVDREAHHGKPRHMPLKYAGSCRQCGEWIEEGSWAYWTKGEGVVCENCF